VRPVNYTFQAAGLMLACHGSTQGLQKVALFPSDASWITAAIGSPPWLIVRRVGSDRGPVSGFATLVRVVVLVVPLVFKLFSLAYELPSARDEHIGIVHVVQFGGRLINSPASRTFNVRIFVRVGHSATPFPSPWEWIRSFLTLRALQHTVALQPADTDAELVDQLEAALGSRSVID
jgi:hypothetical protein